MRPGLLSELAIIGYELFLEGNNVRYRYQKPGNPPDAVRPLLDELRKCKAKVVNILKIRSAAAAPTEKLQPQPKVKASWPRDDQPLIDWFMALEIPKTIYPFFLEEGIRVLGPKYFDGLRRDIANGPEGPRARMGVLQSDLRKLKAYLN
jgi:hypothetical protein